MDQGLQDYLDCLPDDDDPEFNNNFWEEPDAEWFRNLTPEEKKARYGSENP